jgi:peptidoglycan/xylan/chitin deacetylase (PgdA/CDA1 family)
MSQKKPAKAKNNQKQNLPAAVVRYRLLITAIFLAVISAVALQSATDQPPAAPRGGPKKVAGLNLTKERPRQPDNRPRSAQPHLMPWRGPVKPLPVEPNAAAVIHEIPTTDPVVFLTIDDGVTQSPEITDLLTSQSLPFTLFLDDHAIRNDYGYFARLRDAGMSIQNHTMNHARLKTLTFEEQKAEICGASDIFTNAFGQRPTLFRPPYGQFNDDTRRAVLECGMKAIVMWRAVVENGQVYFQFEKTQLEAGDIVVMHFTPNFKSDLEAFTKQVQKDHLRIGRLEDWLK